MPSIRTLLLFAILAVTIGWCVASEKKQPPEPPLQGQTEADNILQIRSVVGSVHHFTIEIADTWEEKRRGLMFREYLPEDQGMLFDFGYAQPLAMWMKDTYIPLDMLFIGDNGRIVHIKENATPLSEAYISSPVPARAVFEIAGGVAKKRAIKAGDMVIHPLFKNTP